MNTDALVYLQEIAETGSFKKAAQNLYISQPALRSTISKLEKDIGGSLLNRTKYGCTLTSLGQMVVNEAPTVLGALAAWQKAAHDDELDNEIILYATKPFCSTILLPVTTALHDRLPQTRFMIRSASYAESLSQLRRGQCQFAIIHADLIEAEALRAQLHIEEAYVIDKIMENDFLALLNVRDPLCAREEIEAADVRDHTFASISTPEMYTKSDLFQVGLGNQQALFYDSHHSIYQVVNHNANYYAVLCSLFATTNDYKIYPDIRFKPIADLASHSAFYLIYAKSQQSGKTRLIAEEIKAYCQKQSIQFT